MGRKASSDLHDSKVRLRRAMKARLAAQSPSERAHSSKLIVDRLLESPEIQRAKRVFTCLSFGIEPNTWDLVARLEAGGKEIFVPRTDLGASQLHVHPYPCEMETLSFGLRQPVATAHQLRPEDIDATLDVAILLGLSFDRRGYRLGYGRGYFDRFLSRRPFSAIGLAFHSQLVPEVPVEPHDIPVAMVVTELELLRTEAAGEKA